MTSQLKAYSFVQSVHDRCLFIFTTSNVILALLVYVDDILVTGNSEAEIKKVKDFLDHKFTIKDLEYAKYFLGLELIRLGTGLFVN